MESKSSKKSASIKAKFQIILKDRRINTSFIEELCSLDQENKNEIINLKSDKNVDYESLDKHCSKLKILMDNKATQALTKIKQNANDPLLCPISLFGTLEYGRLEIAHTRTLGWLLNPTKEHGFAQLIGQALLKEVSTEDKSIEFEITHTESEKSIFSGKKIIGRFDIWGEGFVIQKEKRIPLVFIVEAKIDAAEDLSQLKKYDHWLINNVEKDYRIMKIFLTNNEVTKNNNEKWTNLNYITLVKILRDILLINDSAPGFHFLKYYLQGVLKDVLNFKIPLQDNKTAINNYVLLKKLKLIGEGK